MGVQEKNIPFLSPAGPPEGCAFATISLYFPQGDEKAGLLPDAPRSRGSEERRPFCPNGATYNQVVRRRVAIPRV